jgi:hypothetical protein
MTDFPRTRAFVNGVIIGVSLISIAMAVRLVRFGGVTLGMSYGDRLVSGTRTQERKVISLYGEFAPNLLTTESKH